MNRPAATPGKRILYFADPMCSWCWGFSPVIAAIVAACGADTPVRLCVGGLRAFETRPMDDRSKAYVRHHWEEVERSTGQPFDYGFFDRDGFVYDTEPACRAAVAVRCLVPEAAFNYFSAVQRAFYAENRDVTREGQLAAVAEGLGIDSADFSAVWNAPEVAESTRADFRLSQGLGINGFPTVLLQDGNELAALSVGYRSFADLEPELTAWLAG